MQACFMFRSQKELQSWRFSPSWCFDIGGGERCRLGFKSGPFQTPSLISHAVWMGAESPWEKPLPWEETIPTCSEVNSILYIESEFVFWLQCWEFPVTNLHRLAPQPHSTLLPHFWAFNWLLNFPSHSQAYPQGADLSFFFFFFICWKTPTRLIKAELSSAEFNELNQVYRQTEPMTHMSSLRGTISTNTGQNNKAFSSSSVITDDGVSSPSVGLKWENYLSSACQISSLELVKI